MSETWDVVIIGGGPAGSATAITAQQHGCRALVLEAATFPRHHVGESLIDLWPVLTTLGVAEEMDATFQHKRGSCRIWGREPVLHWTDFGYVKGPRKYSLQVERSEFDLVLLRRAQATGATVRQAHRVTDILWQDGRAVGVRYRTGDGATGEARAPLVVDASGRGSLIARTLGLHVVDPFYPDLSVYGYYQGARRFDGDLAGNLFIEAVPWGWFWYIPLHTGEVSVGLVCDRSSRRRLQQQGPQAFLAEAVAQSTMVRELLSAATLARPPIVTASYGYTSTRYAGPGWLLTGDTGFFIDPMWATGVANALSDGLLAGAVVEAMASGRAEEGDLIAYYDDQVRKKSELIDTIVKFVYRCNRVHADQPFWRRRHETLGTQPLPIETIRRIAGQQWGAYFRAAIQAMGVDEPILEYMDEESRRIERRGERMGGAAREPATWVPVIPASVSVRRGVDLEGATGRIVPGLEVGNGETRIFVSDPYAVAAAEAVDGRRTLREIISDTLVTAPAHEHVGIHFRLLAGFAYLRSQGLVEALAAAEVYA